MKTFYDTFPTRFGDFSVACDETSALLATAFGPVRSVQARLDNRSLIRDERVCRAARTQLQAYFAGDRPTFDLRLAPPGTPFQQRIWRAVQSIPYGETRSYRAVAESVGSPQASRAVGRANATNPICVVVPCHRVIGADGSLTGYAFGEEVKRQLLAFEAATVLRIARDTAAELVAVL